MARFGSRLAIAGCIISAPWQVQAETPGASSITASRETAPREQVLLPYDCTLVDGRLRLTRAAPTAYPIVGRRQLRRIRVCPSSGASPSTSDCSTTVVHRFTLRCGIATVGWLDVAEAAARMNGISAGVAEGRMTLVTRRTLAAGRQCFEKLGKFGPLTEECRPGDRSRVHHISQTFPPGFAPVTLAGARFVRADPAPRSQHFVVGALPPPSAEPARTDPLASAMRLMPEDGSGFVQPASTDEEIGPTLTATATGAWTTRVVTPAELASDETLPMRSQAPAPVDTIPSPLSPLAGWLLALLALGALVGLAYSQLPAIRRLSAHLRGMVLAGRNQSLNARLNEKAESADREGEDEIIASLKRMALAALGDIQPQLAALPPGWDLRAVLLKEAKAAGEKLERLFDETPLDEDQQRRMRGRLQVIVSDLRRLKEIADSANASLSDHPSAGTVAAIPADRDAAYAVLGVNPDVSNKIAKKVVDALRQSWHPDHARDEADRILREARIKQINIAWDLISRERIEA